MSAATRRQSALLDHVGRDHAERFEADLSSRLDEISERGLALLDIAAAAHDGRMKAIIREIEEMWK